MYVESVASNTLTNTTLVGMTYRFYVQFDDPGDRMISVLDANVSILADLFQVSDPVFNSGTDLGPHLVGLEALVENLAADSWVGVNNGAPHGDGDWGDEDPSALGYPGSGAEAFDNGTAIFGGWFLSAGAVDNTPDANLRVKFMTLTFVGENLPQVNGIITIPAVEIPPNEPLFNTYAFAHELIGPMRIAYNPAGTAAGFIQASTFFFNFPSPGALALFGLAGVVGRRRRRKA